MMKMQKKKFLEIGMILLISAAIVCFIAWLVYFKPHNTQPAKYLGYLPTFFTLCNAMAAAFLISGYRYIKSGQKEQHIRAMLSATASSAGFLILYIVYYTFHGDTKFLATGAIRPFYFFILISHILLSAIVLPFILATLYNAYKENYLVHKRIAKITFPIWLYVSITGVLVYLLKLIFNT